MKIGLNTEENEKKSTSDADISDVTFEDDDTSKKLPKNRNIVVVVIALVAILLIAAVFFILKKGNSPRDTQIQESVAETYNYQAQETSRTETDTETETETSWGLGITDYSKDTNMKNDGELSPSTDFLKDLYGVSIPVSYNVKSYDYIKDYVNYEKRRASMDDGMELYWLEITYNGLKYRCTIPFYRYKALNNTGICKVEMEVLTLEGGEKVISYMWVVDDEDK